MAFPDQAILKTIDDVPVKKQSKSKVIESFGKIRNPSFCCHHFCSSSAKRKQCQGKHKKRVLYNKKQWEVLLKWLSCGMHFSHGALDFIPTLLYQNCIREGISSWEERMIPPSGFFCKCTYGHVCIDILQDRMCIKLNKQHTVASSWIYSKNLIKPGISRWGKKTDMLQNIWLCNLCCASAFKASWVTSKSAAEKCPFWGRWKRPSPPPKNLVNLVKEAIKRNNRLAYKFSESLLLPCRTQWKQLAGWEIEGRRTLTFAIVEAFVKFHLTSPLQIWGGGGATYTSFWDVWTENSMLTSYCLLSPHSQNS